MKKNYLKEWWNAICYPMPVLWAPKEVWENFANNATYARVLKAFRDNAHSASGHDKRENLRIILKRLARGNWPKLSKDFICEFSQQIYRVESWETIKEEIKRYPFFNTLYLVDKNDQMLGIFIGRNTVITGVLNDPVSKKTASILMDEGILPTKQQMSDIGMQHAPVSHILDKNGLTFAKNYWVGDWMNLLVWAYAKPIDRILGKNSMFRSALDNDDDYAGLLFVLDV